jgi:uncharacterized protein
LDEITSFNLNARYDDYKKEFYKLCTPEYTPKTGWIRNYDYSFMDKRAALEITKKYAQAVKAKYKFVKIILFGSYAKGNFHKESDIDIAVILKEYDNLIDTQLDLMRLRRKIDSRIEPHPFREKDFDISNPLVHEIVTYGVEVSSM